MRLDGAHRFLLYAPDLECGNATVRIEGEEHRHLHRVLRVRVGDAVYVTNGRGLQVRGEVSALGGDFATVTVSAQVPEQAPPCRVTLAQACLRKDAIEHTVKQCTELGVAAFTPFPSARSHVSGYDSGDLARLQRVALSAMKQSFRARLPAIEPLGDFESLVASTRRYDTVLVGDVEGDTPPASGGDGSVLVIVGPEAGLASDEVERLRSAGAECVRVSRHRLRAETAAAALCAVVLLPG